MLGVKENKYIPSGGLQILGKMGDIIEFNHLITTPTKKKKKVFLYYVIWISLCFFKHLGLQKK